MVLFIGNRGSGKTTIAEVVHTKLLQARYRCIRQFPGLQRRPIGRAMYTALTLWRFFDPTLFRVLGFRGRPPRLFPGAYRLYLPLAFAQDMQKIKNKEADVLLYDSNILRALISGVAEKRIDQQEIVSLCKNKILPHVGKLLIVLLETDPEEAVTRWVARDAVTISEPERVGAISERLHLHEASRSVAMALAQLPNISIMHIDGGIPPEHNAQKIVSRVESLLKY